MNKDGMAWTAETAAVSGGFSWRRRPSWALYALLLAVVFACGAYRSTWFEKEYIFPFPYRQTVEDHALRRGLDPFLVAAVIRTESKFRPRALSPQGAQGLMQMMPDTARWVAQASGEGDFALEQLNDPEVSVRFGTWYLASLRREFQGNEILMLAAYNGGRGTVRQWMAQYGWTMDFRDVQAIPYGETREYVERVLASKEKYAQLYGSKVK